MATSSLTKSFVIKSKVEASNFVKLFSDSEKNQKPLNNVNVVTLSQEKIKELINGKRK